VNRTRNTVAFGLAALAVAIALATTPAQAGPFDKLKKKIETKVTEKTDRATDKAVDRKANDADETSQTEAAAEGKEGAGGTLSSVSTKFDFVPGDRVIFVDDFTQDELGEFPTRWNLARGTFEVAEMKGERWLRCVSSSGSVRMKVPPGLPEFWTLEFDFYGVNLGGAIALTMTAASSGGNTVWETLFPYSGSSVDVRCGSIGSSTPLGSAIEGRHHVMFLGRGSALKVYFDRERVASIPDISAAGIPAEINFTLAAPSKPMITNVRFAEGCRPAKDMLDTGKLVTYGIHFDSGSDVVQPDSAPVLRQIAAYLEKSPQTKLRIIGHTDNVGKAPANLDLSKRRASSVANVLSAQFGIAADRFQADGKGDTVPLSSNVKPEGRATNRRVEFSKIEG
jgi:outer membrane protein OmpA-like peptidoglycan-associated protein